MQAIKKPSLFQLNLSLFLSKETNILVASYKAIVDSMNMVFEFLGINIVKLELIKI